MKFLINSSLYYQAFDTATVICSLNCHRSNSQQILNESLTTSRPVNYQELVVGLDANRFARLDITEPGEFSVNYQAMVQLSSSRVDMSQIEAATDASAFKAVSLPYLAPSRYVPSDRMRKLANDLFRSFASPLKQALAIEDWLFKNLQYQIGSSDEQSWSLDTFESRTGVCRDFAHLGIAFCRALSIPARYVTVYAYQLNPQDFHAVFEAFIGGQWWLFDGTRLAPLNGMIRIAAGRDAAETPLGNLFGSVQGQGVHVGIQLAAGQSDGENFSVVNRDSLRSDEQMLCLG